jgi:hypothetical protein
MVKREWSVKLTPSSCPSGYFCTSGSFVRVCDVLISRVTTLTVSSVAVCLVTVVCVTHVVSSEFSYLCVVICAPKVRLRVPSVSGRSVGVEAGCLD